MNTRTFFARTAASVTIATSLLGLGAGLATAAGTPAALTCADSTTASGTYNCQVSGTTDQTTVTLPVSVTKGVRVPAGTFPMRSGAGTMTVSAESITFTFSADYVATHTAPYTYSGGFDFFVDAYNYAAPFTVTVDADTFTTQGPGGYCDDACKATPLTGTYKSAWDGGNSRVGMGLIRGNDVVVVGQPITFTDVAGPGQSDCNAVIQQQQTDGSWVDMMNAKSTGTTLSATFTPTVGGAVRMNGTCLTDGTQEVYSDQGTIAGVEVSASTTVGKAWADGSGAIPTPAPTPSTPAPSTPAPSTPAPSTPAPSTPAPTATPTSSTPVVTPKPVVPTPQLPQKPFVPMVTETYQVDVATVTGSRDAANRYLAADDDSRLVYRELGALWQNRALAGHFAEKHEFVTIKVPANATSVQRMAAINSRTRLGDVRTTGKAKPTTTGNLKAVYAWRLDTAHGAKPVDGGLAWGPTHKAAQIFFARA